MTQDVAPLFEPFDLAGTIIPNRVAMAPMTRSFSPAGVPGDDVAAYYASRAAGGVGLIITEGTGVDHPSAIGEGSGRHDHIPVLHGADALAGWRKVVDAVHAAGSLIMPQLWHQGPFRIDGTGAVPEAISSRPSGIWGPDGGFSTCTRDFIDQVIAPTRAMTEEEIADAVASFARTAKTAMDIGFDGIAIHGASGYLIDSFLWPPTNHRTDRYGGSMAGRVTFAAEIVRAVRAEIGASAPIIFRFSQWKQQDFNARIAETPDELGIMLRALVDAGVDMFDASTLYYSAPAFEGSDRSLASWARVLSGKPAMAVGGVGLAENLFSSFETGGAAVENNFIDAAARIERGEFDMIGVGRALIADPDWANKVREGRATLPYRRDMLESLG